MSKDHEMFDPPACTDCDNYRATLARIDGLARSVKTDKGARVVVKEILAVTKHKLNERRGNE